MNSDEQLIVYCEKYNEFKVYCNICDNFCIQQFYKNHLKSQTHTNDIRKKKSISNNST